MCRSVAIGTKCTGPARRLHISALACSHTDFGGQPMFWFKTGFFLLITFLTACGGGGGSSTASTTAETATTASAGDSSSNDADSSNAVSSDASGTSTNGVLCDYDDSTFNNQASLTYTSTSQWSCDTQRHLVANGIPDHVVGEFPNPGNPNTIAEQNVAASFSLNPALADNSTTLGGPRGVTAYVLNGVKVDASTAGSCDDTGNSCSLIENGFGWNIEALGQTHFDFGTDDNNAHVQPSGAYHYHGMPEGFIEKRGGSSGTMTLIGWAADGFPIYARYGYSDPEDATSELLVMTGSYQLVDEVPSNRPSTDTYALGTFQQDWEYVEGSGDLDECNGRFGVTPEFPEGIFHYYATDTYPYFQRCVSGVVN